MLHGRNSLCVVLQCYATGIDILVTDDHNTLTLIFSKVCLFAVQTPLLSLGQFRYFFWDFVNGTFVPSQPSPKSFLCSFIILFSTKIHQTQADTTHKVTFTHAYNNSTSRYFQKKALASKYEILHDNMHKQINSGANTSFSSSSFCLRRQCRKSSKICMFVSAASCSNFLFFSERRDSKPSSSLIDTSQPCLRFSRKRQSK